MKKSTGDYKSRTNDMLEKTNITFVKGVINNTGIDVPLIDANIMMAVSWCWEDEVGCCLHHKESGGEIRCRLDDVETAISIAEKRGGLNITVTQIVCPPSWNVLPDNGMEYREWETPFFGYTDEELESMTEEEMAAIDPTPREGDTYWSSGYIPYDTLEVVWDW